MDTAIVSIIVTMSVVTIIVLALRVLYCHRLFKSLKGLRQKMKTQHEQLLQGIDSLKGYHAGLYESTPSKAQEHQYDSTLKPMAEHHYESANRPMPESQFQYSSLAIESGDPYQVIPADEKKIITRKE